MSPQPFTKRYPKYIELDETDLEIRRFEGKYRDAMLEFARSLGEEDLLFLRFDITQPEVVDRWVENEKNGQRVTVIALEKGKDRILGYSSISREPLSWTRHIGEIRAIVNPEHRKIGLGAALTQEIFGICQELELQKVVARMPLRQSGARRMFERLGFSAEALLADWVMDRNGDTHDLVVMSVDVTSLS